MTDAEHLIENVIHAMHENRVDKEFNAWYNQEMMKNTGIKREDLYRMAQHIVYSLYEGLNPFGEHFDEVMDYYHYLKEQDHAPKYVWGNAVQNLDKNLPLPPDTNYDSTDDMSLGAMILFGHDD